MGMGKMKICRNCGRRYEPTNGDELFCSPLCRITGLFRAGGGDTTKPVSEERRKEMAKKGTAVSSPKVEKVPRIRTEVEKYPRVMEMFRLPQGERWRLAKEFTPEEKAYAKRLAKRDLAEERRIDQICSWDGAADEGEVRLERFAGISEGSLGESDDGSI